MVSTIYGKWVQNYASKQDLPRQPKADFAKVWSTFREAGWGLLLIIIIMGGIYAGIFTPTEAAAVAAVYAFFIAVYVYRDIGIKSVPKVLVDASRTTVMLMFVIANAFMFAFVLTTLQIPHVKLQSAMTM